VRLLEPGSPVHQAAEQRPGRCRTAGWPRRGRGRRGRAQVTGVGHDDHELAPEAGPQVRGPVGVGLDGDDPSTDLEQRERQSAQTGPDVEDEVAGADSRVSDEPRGPPRIEFVPSPRPP